MTREDILTGLRSKVQRGELIIGGGAGTGLSAKCEEAGGIDLIVIYNSGRYRMAGRGSIAGYMAYGNANEVVMEMAGEILPVVTSTPVLAGVGRLDMDGRLDALEADFEPDQALAVTDDEVATRAQDTIELRYDPLARRLIEVDHYVAAHDHVERSAQRHRQLD